MMPVRFNKEHVQYFLNCIRDGKSISPQTIPDGWTKFDMLALGGVLCASVFSQGPVKITKEGNELGLLNPKTLEKLPQEYREANEKTFREDILSSFEWVMERAFEVLDDKYDDRLEPIHTVLIHGESKKITPLEGFK